MEGSLIKKYFWLSIDKSLGITYLDLDYHMNGSRTVVKKKKKTDKKIDTQRNENV